MKALLLLAAPLLLGAQSDGRVLDAMDAVGPWKAEGSTGVSAAVASDGQAVKLDYDFNDFAGYAFIRRPLPLTLPDNYEITFRMRWTGGVNGFEMKLVNASGDTVWWRQWQDFDPETGWQTIRVRKRDIEFAWGPVKQDVLESAASMEFVVVRGADGGAGSVEIDDIRIRELPAVAAKLPEPKIARTAGAVTVDYGGLKEMGGAVLRWRQRPGDYTVETSADGREWALRRTVTASDGGDDPIMLPETEARYLRVSGADAAALESVAPQPLAWGEDRNAFIGALAKERIRGSFPRGFTEQSYWTILGTDGGTHSGLISEDGAVEVAKGGFSIEPFVWDGGRWVDWSYKTGKPSLEDGYLPIASVEWLSGGFALKTTSFADAAGRGLFSRYTLHNRSTFARKMKLALVARPYQVNPPAQFLSQRGGISPIRKLEWQGRTLTVTGEAARRDGKAPVTVVAPDTAPDAVQLARFDSGPALGQVAMATTIDDETGLAEGAMIWNADLAPGESRTVTLAVPFPDGKPARAQDYAAAHKATRAYWIEALNRVRIAVPEDKRAVADTVRSALSHMLVSRDGPILRPGTRSYARSWIRDGAMISEGLLRMGVVPPVTDYAAWYTPYLFPNGKVPCCVDFKGADPVPENDSHGEYIYLITQLYRFTGDRAVLRKYWPQMLAAARYQESLRQSERTPANLTPDRRMLYGLMPPSISHEGYSAKAQYSLWDDFWALRGYKDIAFVAELLGKPEAPELARQRDEFQADIHAAIAAAAKHWKIDYIPGATSLGDFDATSTTIGLDPGGEQARLDPELLKGTFDKYYRDFVARASGAKAWKDYTPYELRNVSAMTRLGERARVKVLLDFFFDDRRPAEWNQWAEVVGRKPREIRFIGDMPHAWVSSDYLRAALDLFAYERYEDAELVLGAGLDPGFFAGEGSRIAGMRTPFGALDLAMRGTADSFVTEIGGDARPKGGFVLPWPFPGSPGRTTVNGRPAQWVDGALTIPATGKPIRIEVVGSPLRQRKNQSPIRSPSQRAASAGLRLSVSRSTIKLASRIASTGTRPMSGCSAAVNFASSARLGAISRMAS